MTLNTRDQLAQPADFVVRHIGPTEQQQVEMAGELGYGSVDALIDTAVPDAAGTCHD
jgi:glycine dehydrogenase